MAILRYIDMLEKGQRNYRIYVSDLPECISTAYTPEGSWRNDGCGLFVMMKSHETIDAKRA